MARATLEINISPSPAKLARAMGPDFRKEFSDFRPAWQELLPKWSRGLEQNVRSQGGTLGEQWDPPAAGTVRQRGPGPAGVATGRMLARLGSPALAKRSLTKRRLVVGPKESYPYIFHFGAKSRGQPERRFIAVSQAMRHDGERVMDRFIRARLEALAAKIDRLVGSA